MSPEAVVRHYLDAMERRASATARRKTYERYETAGGKLVDQNVWNDMAEVLGTKLTPL